MSKHSHISAIFDNAFQSRAGSPDVYMSMEKIETMRVSVRNSSNACVSRKMRESWKVWLIQVCSVQNCDKCTQVCMFIRQVAPINDKLKLNFNMYN